MTVTVRMGDVGGEPSGEIRRRLLGRDGDVQVEASTVQDVIDQLIAKNPEAGKMLLDSEGRLRRFLNIYVGEEDIRFTQGFATPLTEGCTVSIVSAVCFLFFQKIERELLGDIATQTAWYLSL